MAKNCRKGLKTTQIEIVSTWFMNAPFKKMKHIWHLQGLMEEILISLIKGKFPVQAKQLQSKQ